MSDTLGSSFNDFSSALATLFGNGGNSISGSSSGNTSSSGVEDAKSTKNSATNGASSTTGTSTGNSVTGVIGTSGTSGTSTTSGTSGTSSTSRASGVQTDSGYTTTHSGSVNTSKLDISQAGIDQLVNDLMSSNSGLASLTSGAHVAGVYNDSTQTLLANDLISRITGEVAAKTGTTTATIGGSNDVVGGRTITNDSTTTSNSNTSSASNTANVSNTANASNTTANTTGTTGSTTDMASNTGEVSNVLTMAGKTQSQNTATTQDTTDNGVLSWVICTELLRQGKLPVRYYVHGARVFSGYPEAVKRGYHFWAVPYVKRMRASEFATWLVTGIFQMRAENIAASAGVTGARKLWRGALVTAILYPICFILGHTIARNLYGKATTPSSLYPFRDKGV